MATALTVGRLDDLAPGTMRMNAAACTVECPRHGSAFDLRDGRPLCLPAYEPVETFAVIVKDGEIRVAVE